MLSPITPPRRQTPPSEYVSPLQHRFPGTRTYQAFQSETGTLHLPTSPVTGKKRSVVYILRDQKTGETYIGKTDQEFRRRLSQHCYLANHPERDGSERPIYEMMRRSPEWLEFGIVPKRPGQSLEKLERELIKRVPKHRRLNANRGGGGGTTLPPPTSTPSQRVELLDTPKKYYPFYLRDNGSIGVKLTPNGKRERGVVYVIKDAETGKRKVGMTSQELGERTDQYLTAVNNPRKQLGQDALSKGLRQNPHQYSVGILAKAPLGDLPGLETHYIKEKDSLANGFNRNRGGGGSGSSYSRQKDRKRLKRLNLNLF